MGLIQTLKTIFSRFTGSDTQSGTIKFFDRKKRFGFIVSGKKEYFFHATSTNPNDFRALRDGANVTFNVIQGKKGAQADNVKIVAQ
jgi:CspA family cold shock protein